jgi:hypothetical protein
LIVVAGQERVGKEERLVAIKVALRNLVAEVSSPSRNQICDRRSIKIMNMMWMMPMDKCLTPSNQVEDMGESTAKKMRIF